MGWLTYGGGTGKEVRGDTLSDRPLRLDLVVKLVVKRAYANFEYCPIRAEMTLFEEAFQLAQPSSSSEQEELVRTK